jgi:hypothetical protein
MLMFSFQARWIPAASGPIDLDALDDYLMSDRTRRRMWLSDLDGFLTGIAVVQVIPPVNGYR